MRRDRTIPVASGVNTVLIHLVVKSRLFTIFVFCEKLTIPLQEINTFHIQMSRHVCIVTAGLLFDSIKIAFPLHNTYQSSISCSIL